MSMSTSRELLNFNFNSTNITDDLLCSEEEILLYLRALDMKKSTGTDGISAVMLKMNCIMLLHLVSNKCSIYQFVLQNFPMTRSLLEWSQSLRLMLETIQLTTD